MHTHTQDYANQNPITLCKQKLLYYTQAHVSLYDSHTPQETQLPPKKKKNYSFCAVEGDSTATHTPHLHQLANTALKAVYHSVIFTRAVTKHEAVKTMLCYPLH